MDKKAASGSGVIFDTMKALEDDAARSAEASKEIQRVLLKNLAPAVLNSKLTSIE